MKTEKIEIAKIYKLNSPHKVASSRINNIKLPEDKFIKKERNMDNERFIKNISNCDFDSITKKLTQKGRWSDGINMIAYNKVNGKISSVSVAAPEFGTLAKEADIIAVEDFVDLFTHVTANKIRNNPEKETFYKNCFVNILEDINRNKYNK